MSMVYVGIVRYVMKYVCKSCAELKKITGLQVAVGNLRPCTICREVYSSEELYVLEQAERIDDGKRKQTKTGEQQASIRGKLGQDLRKKGTTGLSKRKKRKTQTECSN